MDESVTSVGGKKPTTGSSFSVVELSVSVAVSVVRPLAEPELETVKTARPLALVVVGFGALTETPVSAVWASETFAPLMGVSDESFSVTSTVMLDPAAALVVTARTLEKDWLGTGGTAPAGAAPITP